MEVLVLKFENCKDVRLVIMLSVRRVTTRVAALG